MESTCDNHEIQSELMLDFQVSGIEQITSKGFLQGCIRSFQVSFLSVFFVCANSAIV